MEENFLEIIRLIKLARASAVKAVNTELINLYWNVGAYIGKRIRNASWGEKKVDELAAFIKKNHPELKGFNRRGLYRMKQFFETYASAPFVSPAIASVPLPQIQDSEIVSSPMTHERHPAKPSGQNELDASFNAHLPNQKRRGKRILYPLVQQGKLHG